VPVAVFVMLDDVQRRVVVQRVWSVSAVAVVACRHTTDSAPQFTTAQLLSDVTVLGTGNCSFVVKLEVFPWSLRRY